MAFGPGFISPNDGLPQWVRLSELLAVSFFERPYSDKVVIAELANIFNSKRQERLGSAVSCDKFNLEFIWRMKFNNRTEVTAA